MFVYSKEQKKDYNIRGGFPFVASLNMLSRFVV